MSARQIALLGLCATVMADASPAPAQSRPDPAAEFARRSAAEPAPTVSRAGDFEERLYKRAGKAWMFDHLVLARGRYAADGPAMRKRAEVRGTLGELAATIREAFAKTPADALPPALWRHMLDLIYTGQAKAARDLLDQGWKRDTAAKERFWDEFRDQPQQERDLAPLRARQGPQRRGGDPTASALMLTPRRADRRSRTGSSPPGRSRDRRGTPAGAPAHRRRSSRECC